MLRFLALTLVVGAWVTLPAMAQDGNSQDKSFDVRSSVGDCLFIPAPIQNTRRITIPSISEY